MIKYMNLQLFAEEAAAPEGASQIATEDTGSSAESTESQIATDTPTFDDLIKGEYKKDYDQRVKDAVNKRVKNLKVHEERMNQMTPVIELFGRRYGIDTQNMNDEQYAQLINQIMDDNSFYEDDALDMGMEVDALKEMRRTQFENQQMKRMMEQSQQMQENQMKFNRLGAEAEALKQLYPGFDLDTEMQNPEFERLAWKAGVPLQTAYEVIHKNEIMANGMQYAVQQTKEKISKNIQSGYRPREGASNPNAASLSKGKRPSEMSKEELADIRKRVKAGERVVL